MSHLFSDSFDAYASLADVSSRWPGAQASAGYSRVSTQAETAFNSGQGFAFVPYAQYLSAPLPSNESTIFGTMRFNLSGQDVSRSVAVQVADGLFNTIQATIVLWADGRIEARTGSMYGTIIGSAASGYLNVGWNSIQYKFVISDTAGEVHVRVNGAVTEVLSVVGANTRGGSTNNYANRFNVVTGQNYDVSNHYFIDDVFLCSGSGDAPNNWLPEIRAIQQTPISSSQTQFLVTGAASNWQAVGENHSDADATYVSASVPGTEDRYGLSQIAAGLTIVGINYFAIWRKADSGAASGVLTINGTEIATDSGMGTSYSMFSIFRNADQNGTPFTSSTANSMLLGIKVGA